MVFYKIYVIVFVLILSYFISPIFIASGGDLPTGISDQIGSAVTVEGDIMTHITGDMKCWGDAESFDIGINNTLNSIGPNSSAVMLYNVTGDVGPSLVGGQNNNQFLGTNNVDVSAVIIDSGNGGYALTVEEEVSVNSNATRGTSLNLNGVIR